MTSQQASSTQETVSPPFTVEKVGIYQVLRIANAEMGLSKEVQKAIAQFVVESLSENPVVDLQSTLAIDHYFIREIAGALKEGKASGHKLRLFRSPLAAVQMVKEMGMDAVIDATFDLTVETQSKPQLNTAFINPFLSATQDVLRIQCSMETKPGKLSLKAEQVIPSDIIGVIGLTSTAFKGSIAICFSEKIFLELMSGMLGEKFDTITKDIEDGAGELLNMIFGQAKKELNERGFSIEKAIPTVIRGNAMSVNHLSQTPVVVLPFETHVGIFYVQIGIS